MILILGKVTACSFCFSVFSSILFYYFLFVKAWLFGFTKSAVFWLGTGPGSYVGCAINVFATFV